MIYNLYPFVQKVIGTVEDFWSFVQNFFASFVLTFFLQISTWLSDFWTKVCYYLILIFKLILDPVSVVHEWVQNVFGFTVSNLVTRLNNALSIFDPLANAIQDLKSTGSVAKVATVFSNMILLFPEWLIHVFILGFAVLLLVIVVRVVIDLL